MKFQLLITIKPVVINLFFQNKSISQDSDLFHAVSALNFLTSRFDKD